ncbi:hypothetical protein C8Q76DRAFT_632973, partial [Earliella scabrosa]
CVLCQKHPAEYRCEECSGRLIVCKECLVAQHTRLPCHRVQYFNGAFFECSSLRELGVVIQLGHGGLPCANSAKNTRRLVVVTCTGIHEVEARFCECLCEDGTEFVPQWVQCMRFGWFPATTTVKIEVT